jgi:2-dehydro-3-deoxyglucarate aldolase/4-hydroxy-2-oxoheptanedioate aldolase
MIQQNELKSRLKKGDAAIGCMLQAGRDPEVLYHLAAAGVDFCFIDMEHGPYNVESVADLILHSRGAGISPLVRIADLQYEHVTRLLDNGAQTILVPHMSEPSEVARLVELSYYAPHGHRGMAIGLNAGSNFEAPADLAEAAASANEQMLVGINIETPSAVEQAKDMLMPGIDFVMVGFADLAQGYGYLGEHDHGLVRSAQDEIRSLAREREIAYMAVAPSSGAVEAELEAGSQVILFGGTMGLLRGAIGPFAEVMASWRENRNS